ncbi:MAG TPA: FAD-binding oxidoreductase [Methylomirabilota bacterium]|nr:FAD-binding oxidoreductase [Methylomirabilota bacterium]
MSAPTAEVVICGAGIAGVAAAYHLTVRRGVRSVVLVDERPPLSLTSDKSAESYRNWWPGPGDDMVALMNRSIDLMEELARESDNAFLLNRRGYLFATAQAEQIDRYLKAGRDAASRGVGPLRVHDSPGGDYRPSPATGFEGQPTGTDVVTDRGLIRRHFPYLAEDTVALLHARRCGWFSGQQLGMYMLERAREAGVRLTEGRVDAVTTAGGRVTAVQVSGRAGNRTIATPRFVNAAGPYVKQVGRLLGIELPVFCERHAKVAFHDPQGVVPRDAPMMIWTDPVRLPWADDEREELEQAESHRHLLDEMPAGVHGRPEGGGDSPVMLGVWTYDVEPMEPRFPVEFDPAYAEIVIRGLTRLIPGLRAYVPRLPKYFVDGGYYTKTEENRLLSGPLPIEGAYVLGGLSGYGMMSSNGAADLLADYIAGRPLPRYAAAFRLDRYQDPAYRARLAEWGDSGQL